MAPLMKLSRQVSEITETAETARGRGGNAACTEDQRLLSRRTCALAPKEAVRLATPIAPVGAIATACVLSACTTAPNMRYSPPCPYIWMTWRSPVIRR